MAVIKSIKLHLAPRNFIARLTASDRLKGFILALFPDFGKVTTITNGELVKVERFGEIEYQKDERHGKH